MAEITSTPGHKYYVPENTSLRELDEVQEHASYYGLSEKWVSAKNLKPGDKVLLSDGTFGVVQSVSIENLSIPEATYNLEVSDFHTYYVTESNILVHNRNCGEYKPFRPEGKDGYRVTINSGESELPHAHIYKKGQSVGRIFRNGKMDVSLSNNRDAIKFINRYKSRIMSIIDDFYGR